MSGRGDDGTVDKHGDNLITACTTGHHDASFRHTPLRHTMVLVAKLFGAVSVRAEDGHYFLRAFTPQALFTAINEGDLTSQCAPAHCLRALLIDAVPCRAARGQVGVRRRRSSAARTGRCGS